MRKNKVRITSWLLVALLAAMLVLTGCEQKTAETQNNNSAASQSTVASTQETTTVVAATALNPEKDKAYLKEFFNISLEEEFTNQDFLKAALALGIVPEDMDITANIPTEKATWQELLPIAVTAANMNELAAVLTDKEVQNILGSVEVDKEIAQNLAAAISTGLIDGDILQNLDKDVLVEQANNLLLRMAQMNGAGRNTLGLTNDVDIYGRLNGAWNSFPMFQDDVLLGLGLEAVVNQITTGYNLRNSDYDARFLPEYTLRYGHSDIQHAQQLIGLLNSHGIVAQVQLEPKTSIFEYLPEWGDPGEPTPFYKVETFENGLMLAFAIEYDLVLEFETKDAKDAFDKIIEEYAKKNTGEEGKNLLRASWWQPLYVSHVEMGDGYHKINDNVFTNGKYSLHPFSLEERGSEVLDELSALAPEVECELVPIWCDDAFYRYLNGESE